MVWCLSICLFHLWSLDMYSVTQPGFNAATVPFGSSEGGLIYLLPVIFQTLLLVVK